jgi:hypothetical protein
MEVTSVSRMRNEYFEDTNRGKMWVSEVGGRAGARGSPRFRELIVEGKEHENE